MLVERSDKGKMSETEEGVYTFLLSDVGYSLAMFGLFFILKFPTYWLWYLHGATWLTLFLFMASQSTDFWIPTLALVLSLSGVAVDVFILANTLCYVPSLQCCTSGSTMSPFTLGFQVCGASTRIDETVLDWMAVGAVCFGLLSAIIRTWNMHVSRKASSLEGAFAVAYVGIKIYILMWTGVSYTIYFYVQSGITMGANLVAYVMSFKLRLVSTLLFAGVMLVDLLVVLGATKTISFFESDVVKHAPGRRHLLLAANTTVALADPLTPVVDVGKSLVKTSTWRLVQKYVFKLWDIVWGLALKPAEDLQTPWVTSSGADVPLTIRNVWLAAHCVCIGLTAWELVGTLTRSHKLPGVFGVSAYKAEEPVAAEEEEEVSVVQPQGSTRKRTKGKAESS